MNQILSLIELTDKMEHILQEEKADDRDRIIEEFNKLLELREELLIKMKDKSFSDEEKEQLYQINKKSQEIIQKITLMKNAIQKDILQAKKGKDAFKGYHQYYQPPAQDGYYFDKKK
ncbi:hypothetical protein CU633_06875 [Bacillus sp. V3-13]|uniref:hypothetical protein n=1 Tax=Bacillus sp. V3-13 TaxID=2053728 RepID=UPI000C770125|nr:hypothetical protein [Bacillus sp. V3-13]PLR78233.1 hypothetical protein CU633_06875 [Bacillus sp. V3-13]